MITHENYIARVHQLCLARVQSDETAFKQLGSIKLAFGAGAPGLRGVTYYNRWGKGETKAPFVEICAFGKEHAIQLAGTTIHELGHVLAPIGAGHGKEWHLACDRLGLRHCHAAGHEYRWADFHPDIRLALAALPAVDEGEPVNGLLPGFGGSPVKVRSCPAGIGTRGGKSRGTGSGSRLRLFECECVPPVKARVAREVFAATCDCCNSGFRLIPKGA
jgi:hypothetical protein